MKTLLFLLTAFIALLGSSITLRESAPATPLAKVEIPTGEQMYFSVKIKGINAKMVKTAEKTIRVELFAEAPTDKSPVSKEAFFQDYTFDVNQTTQAIEAQVTLKPGVNTPVKLNKWLVIYLPQSKRFHLETAHKMYFGAGFQDLNGSYSGTADFGPTASIPDTRGHHNPTPEMEPEEKKPDSDGSKKSVQLNSSAIEGTWQIQDGDRQHILIIQDGFFFHSFYNKSGKDFISTQGGTYTIENQKISAKIYFDTENKEIIGKYLNGSVSVNNNTMKLSINRQGKDWERLDNGSAPLAGIWKITSRMQDGKITPIHQTGARQTYKILSGTRFHWAAINPETKEFLGAGGGTYTFSNGKYTENIEFFSRDNSRVGASLSFDGKLENGEWHHSGLSSKGEKMYEVWSRVK